MPRRKTPDRMTAEEEIRSVLDWAQRTGHVNIAAALRRARQMARSSGAETAAFMTADQLPSEIVPQPRRRHVRPDQQRR